MASRNLSDSFSSALGADSTAVDPAASNPSTVPTNIASSSAATGDRPDNRTQIFSQIQSPVYLNLPFLDGLVKQAAVLTAATGGDIFGTVHAAKPNPKPFIVGFIPPDVPVNYLPVSVVKSQIGTVNSRESNSKQGPSGTASNREYSPSGQPGLQPKTSTPISNAQLRQEVAAAVRQLNPGANDTQVALVFAQMCIERGFNMAKPELGNIYNYNLGNFHAGGGTKFLDFKPDENSTLPAPDQLPKGGSYFLTFDYTGNQSSPGQPANSPYAVYMQSWDSLHAAVLSQVGQVYGGWPGTRTAQDATAFAQALVPSQFGAPVGHDYYAVPAAQYAGGIAAGAGQFFATGGVSASKIQSSTSAPTSTVSVAASNNTTPAVQSGSPIGTIMDNGDISLAGEDPLQTTLGRRIQVDSQRRDITDAYTRSIINDINIVKATPPLLMLVNPTSFERSYDRAADTGIKGRQGHIVHIWHERPVSISCKGQTAGQYVFDASGSGGLSSLNRVQSISYQNLLSLVLAYKNNGVIFDGFSRGSGSTGIPIIQMSLYIYYDNHLYIGTFDDFSVDDAADKPYNMEYSFKFNVRYDIEVDATNITDNTITAAFTVVPSPVPPTVSGNNSVLGSLPPVFVPSTGKSGVTP